jgi:hypothetical protein
MAYVNYEEHVVHRYGVELTEWTPDKWCSPSELTSSIPVLRTLLNALKAGECSWVKLDRAVLTQRKAAYDEAIAAGCITGVQRAPRCDIGKKHKHVVNDDNDDSAEDNHPADSDEDSDPAASTTHRQYSVEDPEAPAPPTKRRKALASANNTQPRTRKAAVKPKAPKATAGKAAAPSGAARPKPRLTAKAVRSDETTLAALQRLKDGRVPGSGPGRSFKSRAVISEDEDEDDTPSITDTGTPAFPMVIVTDRAGPVATALTTVI